MAYVTRTPEVQRTGVVPTAWFEVRDIYGETTALAPERVDPAESWLSHGWKSRGASAGSHRSHPGLARQPSPGPTAPASKWLLGIGLEPPPPNRSSSTANTARFFSASPPNSATPGRRDFARSSLSRWVTIRRSPPS